MSSPIVGGIPSRLSPPGQPNPLQPGEFIPSAPADLVTFELDKSAAPAALYIQQDDTICIGAISRNNNEVLLVRGRFLRAADGVIVPFAQTFNVGAANYTYTQGTLVLDEGWLLSLAVTCQTEQNRGGTWVQLELQRGTPVGGGNLSYTQILCQGYVTITQPNGWPYGRRENSLSGEGLYSQTNQSPVAGTDIALTSNGLAYRRMRWIQATLTTSAAVANRNIVWQVTDATILNYGVLASVPASTVRTFLLGIGLVNFADLSGNVQMALTSLGLSQVAAGANLVATLTTNLQAGDQWSNVRCGYTEWQFPG